MRLRRMGWGAGVVMAVFAGSGVGRGEIKIRAKTD